MFQSFDWIDTHYPLWVPRILTPVFGTFLMRQAFKTLPQELEDAARVDGASTFTIYWRIMLPQVKPAMAAIGVFTFVESWNDLFGPLIFINSTELQTLPMALALFQGEFFTNISLLMAASTITIFPVLAIYLAAQKYFVQGIASTGMKG
jgi:multiple sugar transport system permease protein